MLLMVISSPFLFGLKRCANNFVRLCMILGRVAAVCGGFGPLPAAGAGALPLGGLPPAAGAGALPLGGLPPAAGAGALPLGGLPPAAGAGALPLGGLPPAAGAGALPPGFWAAAF